MTTSKHGKQENESLFKCVQRITNLIWSHLVNVVFMAGVLIVFYRHVVLIAEKPGNYYSLSLQHSVC